MVYRRINFDTKANPLTLEGGEGFAGADEEKLNDGTEYKRYGKQTEHIVLD